jgi:hypothetical protein
MSEESEIEKLQKKYRRMYKQGNYSSNGGIFTKKRRKQLLGLKGKSGRDRPLEGQSKYSFWYDVRENLKNGLIDLQLFIEAADEENVNNVLTRQSIEPVVYAFFFFQKPQNENDVSSKAKVAHMLVEHGLNYLRSESRFGQLRKKEEKEIDEAIELSNQLAFRLLTEGERMKVLWDEVRSRNKNQNVNEEK